MTKKNFLYCLLGVQDGDLSVLSQTMAQCCKNIKETVQMLASRHKDIHGSVSKVGKAIDRVSTKTTPIFSYRSVWISIVLGKFQFCACTFFPFRISTQR